jgi:hypothetical protein
MNLEQQKETLANFQKLMASIMLNKGDDYAKSDRLSNFKEVGNSCQIKPQQACLVLIATKVSRLGTLYSSSNPPKNEAILDSIVDLANYSALLYMLEVESPNIKLPIDEPKQREPRIGPDSDGGAASC